MYVVFPVIENKNMAGDKPSHRVSKFLPCSAKKIADSCQHSGRQCIDTTQARMTHGSGECENPLAPGTHSCRMSSCNDNLWLPRRLTVQRRTNPADHLAPPFQHVRRRRPRAVAVEEIVDEPHDDTGDEHGEQRRGVFDTLPHRRRLRLPEFRGRAAREQRRVLALLRGAVRGAEVPTGGRVPPSVVVDLEEKDQVANGVLSAGANFQQCTEGVTAGESEPTYAPRMMTVGSSLAIKAPPKLQRSPRSQTRTNVRLSPSPDFSL